MLQSIPCSPECKIVWQILLNHQLSKLNYCHCRCPCCVLTTILEDDILQLPVETLDNPFVAPVNIETIEAFMNKVFNRCLTPRTSGHDQTNINILQLFHAMINRTNIDYAALLWQNFMNNVRQKKEAIQYPRFIKLIIADLMKKFLEIPKRIEEDYHSIKDDIPLIRATNDFKEYESVFMKSLGEEEEAEVLEESQDQQEAITQNNIKRKETKYNTNSPPKKNDEEIENEKNNDNIEETDKVIKEKDIVDDVTGSTKIRKEQKQTPIPHNN
ncbi:hypothetical protein Tco_1517689 [Tanacetum coccineum]